MGRLNNLDAIETIDGPASTTPEPSYESTPAQDNQLYDYTQNQQDNSDNLFADDTSDDEEEDNNKKDTTEDTSGQDALIATTEQARAEQANNGRSYVDTAVANTTGEQPAQQEGLNNILQQTGVTADEWKRITDPNFNIQGLLADKSAEGQKYRDAYAAYQNMMQGAQQAPAQQGQQTLMTSASEAPQTGTYADPKGYYDPNQKYGRLDNGDFVYSNSAKQLQNNLAREGYYKGSIDGYFGEQTQQALNNYLADNGIKVEEDKGSQTLADSGNEAPAPSNPTANTQAATQQITGQTTTAPATQTSNLDQAVNASSPSKKSTHDDAWYADQYEKITGNAPRTDILSPERIKNFVDTQLQKLGEAWQGEEYDRLLMENAQAEQAQKQAETDALNQRRDEYFTPKFEKDLKGGKSVEQIIAENDKSYNRWINDNWDDLSYTYNLQGNPFEIGENQDAERLSRFSDLEKAYRESVIGKDGLTGQQQADFDQMDRNDWYQRPEQQSPAQSEPINYDALADLMNQMDRNDWYQRTETQQEPASREPINYDALANELFQADRNDWYQRPETPEAPTRTPIEYSDAFIRQQDMNDAYSPRQSYNNNYRAELEKMQSQPDIIASDDIQSSGTPNYFTQEQNADEARAAMESNYGQRVPTNNETMYLFQYISDMDNLKKQFPNYSDSALMDMMLVNEEMRNGQSSYYKWLSSQL